MNGQSKHAFVPCPKFSLRNFPLDQKNNPEPFWRTKTLEEMTKTEWESLCDGCAKCCLVKMQEYEGGPVEYTNLACYLLDVNSCKCSDYPNRLKRKANCIELGPHNIKELHWMPSTCAYRLVAEGKDLYDWHPLKTGDPFSVVQAGVSAMGRIQTERNVSELFHHRYKVQWPK